MNAFWVLALLGAGVPMTAATSSGCLCTYGQSCWPSASVFMQLQSQVSQPLIHPLPTASPCYPPSDPSGNCADVIANWHDGNWRSSVPGSAQWPNWETFTFQNGTIDACYLNTTITGKCQQGRVPVIGVDARTVEDIQAAVNFAVQYNLKLVVKNTGHDYFGRSAARGSFVVWTHNMKDITHNPVFVPQGSLAAETYEAVTLGAGVQWHEAYAAVYAYGHLMIGGYSTNGSVGSAGGWLAGGGHSPISPKFGLGVDNALEISVVLSTGEFLVTNEYQNSDLFWALRGGGGSTYGVVTSVTYRTYPEVPTQVYLYEANTTNSSALQELVGGLLQHQAQFTDDGWGGYGAISDQQVRFFYFAPDMTNETAAATTQAWHNYSLSLAPFGVVFKDQLNLSPSWYDVLSFSSLISSVLPDASNVVITNRLLSRNTLANKHTEAAETLVSCNASFGLVAGGKVNQIPADSAGVNPAWRDAVGVYYCFIGWEDGTSSSGIQSLISVLKGWIKALYDLAPEDGTYLNEASPFEIDWQQTFFGSHYSKLKAIKDVYDPHRLFVVEEGVGSEEWNKDLTCRY